MRVCGRDDQQGQVAGAFLAKTFADKNIAIIDDKSAYGKGLADETRKYMNEAGKTEVLNESYNAGEKDYSALVSKLKAANIDVLYVGGYHTEAGLIKRQMVDQGMSTILVSGDALVTDEYWQITGDAGAGTLMTFSPDPRKNPKAKPVRRRAGSRRQDHRGLCALHLRRHPGVGRGRDPGRHHRLRPGGRGARLGRVRHRPRRREVRRQGRRHPAGLRLLRVEERHLRLHEVSPARTLATDGKPRRKRRGFSFVREGLSLGA